MAEQPAQHRYLWEDFELDLRLRRLFRGGHRVRLQPIPLQILLLLLERPGEVVSRDDLHHRIWNGYSYGDFDHSLNIAINKLRAALSDSAKQPRYIETLPQVGYRFIAHLESADSRAPLPDSAEAFAPDETWRPSRSMWLAVAVSALLLGLVSYATLPWGRPRAKSQPHDSVAEAEADAIPSGLVLQVAPGGPPRRFFRLTGSGVDYVRVPNEAGLEPEHVTVGAWVRAAESPGKFRYVVAKGALGCAAGSYALYTARNGGMAFYAGDPARGIVTSPIAKPLLWDGAWHHVAGTFDGDFTRLYLDGVEVGSGSRNETRVRINYKLPLDNDLLVGNFVGNCAVPFKGDVGDVRVYARALRPSEISYVHDRTKARWQAQNPPGASAQPIPHSPACVAPPPGLVAWWSGDETSDDVSGRHRATPVDGMAFGAGKVGSGFLFYGASRFEVAHKPDFDFVQGLTLEGWVFSRAFRIREQFGAPILAKWDNAAPTGAAYGLFIRPNGALAFALTSERTDIVRAESPLPMIVDLTHVAGVWNGTEMHLFLNGARIATKPFAGPIRRNHSPLSIGGFGPGPKGAYFNGVLDELSIYNRALTENEILAIYRAGSAGKCR